jgi:hypothetical protein
VEKVSKLVPISTYNKYLNRLWYHDV